MKYIFSFTKKQENKNLFLSMFKSLILVLINWLKKKIILNMSAPTELKHADKKFSYRGFDQVQMIGKNMDEIK